MYANKIPPLKQLSTLSAALQALQAARRPLVGKNPLRAADISATYIEAIKHYQAVFKLIPPTLNSINASHHTDQKSRKSLRRLLLRPAQRLRNWFAKRKPNAFANAWEQYLLQQKQAFEHYQQGLAYALYFNYLSQWVELLLAQCKFNWAASVNPLGMLTELSAKADLGFAVIGEPGSIWHQQFKGLKAIADAMIKDKPLTLGSWLITQTDIDCIQTTFTILQEACLIHRLPGTQALWQTFLVDSLAAYEKLPSDQKQKILAYWQPLLTASCKIAAQENERGLAHAISDALARMRMQSNTTIISHTPEALAALLTDLNLLIGTLCVNAVLTASHLTLSEKVENVTVDKRINELLSVKGRCTAQASLDVQQRMSNACDTLLKSCRSLHSLGHPLPHHEAVTASLLAIQVDLPTPNVKPLAEVLPPARTPHFFHEPQKGDVTHADQKTPAPLPTCAKQQEDVSMQHYQSNQDRLTEFKQAINALLTEYKENNPKKWVDTRSRVNDNCQAIERLLNDTTYVTAFALRVGLEVHVAAFSQQGYFRSIWPLEKKLKKLLKATHFQAYYLLQEAYHNQTLSLNQVVAENDRNRLALQNHYQAQESNHALQQATRTAAGAQNLVVEFQLTTLQAKLEEREKQITALETRNNNLEDKYNEIMQAFHKLIHDNRELKSTIQDLNDRLKKFEQKTPVLGSSNHI
jgi:hypothetical protein